MFYTMHTVENPKKGQSSEMLFGKKYQSGYTILGIIAFLLTSFSKICLVGPLSCAPLPASRPNMCIYVIWVHLWVTTHLFLNHHISFSQWEIHNQDMWELESSIFFYTGPNSNLLYLFINIYFKSPIVNRNLGIN